MKTASRIRTAASIAMILVTGAFVAACAPKPETHKSFATPEEAVSALVAAVEKGDMASLGLLLGPGSEGILSSGDAVADKQDREDFLASYRAKNALVAEGEGKRILQLGADGWPLPIPVVQKDGRWYLDGAEGADEIIYRRVGENELGAIAVALGYVEAQEEYAAAARDNNPPGVYAQKVRSDPGRQNGLYWPAAEGEEPSPVGAFVASAVEEGYRASIGGERVPYHGYYYRALYAQGPNANGGAFGYFTDGLLTEGFAFVAWPAEYGVSGVKTFMVNQDGVVFEKDLGEDTDTVVETIQSFDPDSSWTAIEAPAGA